MRPDASRGCVYTGKKRWPTDPTDLLQEVHEQISESATSAFAGQSSSYPGHGKEASQAKVEVYLDLG